MSYQDARVDAFRAATRMLLAGGCAFLIGCQGRPYVASDPPLAQCDCVESAGVFEVLTVYEESLLPPLAERKIRSARKAKGGMGPGLTLRAANQQPLQVFFGNLHSHTSYSDGTGLPAEAFFHARHEAELDFLALTEHNHREAGRRNGRRIAFHNDRYEGPRSDALILVANRLTQNGSFVALYGQEFSTISAGNHVNVFDVPHVIDDRVVKKGEFGDLFDSWLPSNLDTTGEQALLQLNHPWARSSPNEKEYGRDDLGTFRVWRSRLDQQAQLIEVINGPAFGRGTGREPHESGAEYRRYLNMGFHLAPTANQDNHRRTWGTITDARTGVVAEELTKPAILEALRSRRAYASLDRNLRIIATVEGELCGAIISGSIANGHELDIEIAIDDDDEPTGRYWVEVFADEIDGRSGNARASLVATYGPLDASDDPNASNIWMLPGLAYDGWDYLYFRVLQGDVSSVERQAWLAPVWFEPAN